MAKLCQHINQPAKPPPSRWMTFEPLKRVFSGVRIKSYGLKIIKMGRPSPSGQTVWSSKSTNETIGSNRNTTDSGWQSFPELVEIKISEHEGWIMPSAGDQDQGPTNRIKVSIYFGIFTITIPTVIVQTSWRKQGVFGTENLFIASILFFAVERSHLSGALMSGALSLTVLLKPQRAATRCHRNSSYTVSRRVICL